MRTPDAASTVTTNSDHPRTELREKEVSDWEFGTGNHTLVAKVSVLSVSNTTGQTVIGQIHGSVNEEIAKVVKLRWNRDGSVEARVKNNSSPYLEYGLSCGKFSLGEQLTYVINLNKTLLKVTVNGNLCGGIIHKPPFNSADKYYFKVGNYNQCAPCLKSKGIAKVALLAIQTVHT